MKELSQTSVYNELMKSLNQKNMIWDAPMGEIVYKVLFESMARYLSGKKDKQKVVGIEISKTDGDCEFVFGSFITFMPSAEDETKGSYNITYTFDKDSFKSQTDITETQSNTTFRSILYDISSREHGVEFKSSSRVDFIGIIFIAACEALKKYLTMNIDMDPQVKLDEFFTATAQKDGNNVFISIEPSAVIKQIIKDDASIEV